MDTAPEIDSSPELDVTSELTKPKIDVTSEIVKATSKNDIETETMAEAMSEKNSVDDVSTVDTTSEIHVMSNADVASNKIEDVVSTASDITVPPRGLRQKSYADQRGRRHSIASLDRSVSKHKFQRNLAEAENDDAVSSVDVLASHDNFCGNIRRRYGENSRESSEKSRIQQASAAEEEPLEVNRSEGVFVQTTSEITKETSSAVEIEKSTLEGASAMIGVQKTRGAEGLSGIKKRKTKSSLGSSLKRKVDLIERILEDQVERIWEENVEKHTWLQPIETWIADRRSTSNYTHQLTDAPDGFNSTDVKPDAVPEPTYDFKFTPATEENEEPKIEIGLMKGRQAAKTDEPKIENKIIEHLQRLRNRNPKSDRFEPASSSTQLNKQEIVSEHVINGKESLNVLNGSDVLEVKEIKRHDLIDRLKDNVKEKLEDFHRVEQRKQFFIL